MSMLDEEKCYQYLSFLSLFVPPSYNVYPYNYLKMVFEDVFFIKLCSCEAIYAILKLNRMFGGYNYE